MESIGITKAQFRKLTLPVAGLRISKPWLGYANALFLELGKLHFEPLPPVPIARRKTKSLRGQAGVMIDSDWRIEHDGTFSVGRDSRDGLIRQGIRSLRGRRIRRVNLHPCGPELFLEVEGGIHLHTFATHASPCWAIFLKDSELFPPPRRWLKIEHTLLVTVDEATGRLSRNVCY